MELRGRKRLYHIQNIEGEHLHHIQNIKGGVVTKVLNVSHGQPKIAFKSITYIHGHESLLVDNDDAEAVRSCIDVMGEGTVKTKPHDWVCDADDGNVQRFHNLDDGDGDDCAILTLKQIKESCKARKIKRSQDLNSSKIKIKTEDTLDDCMEKQQMEDDPDLMETLSNLRAKRSKNMKTKKKKKCIKDHPMPSQEIVLVDKSEEVLDGPEFSPSSGNSAILDEINFECLENCFDGPDDCSSRGSKDAETTLEWNLQNELNYKWKGFLDYIPLRAVNTSGMDIVISNSELSSNHSSNFPAIEFEDHDNYYTFDNQLDNDTDIPGSPPKVASHKDLDSMDLEVRRDNTLLGDCGEECTAGAEVQEKPCSTVEHGLNPDGYVVYCSDDSPEYEEKQSLASLSDDDTGTLVSPSKVTSHKDLDFEALEIRDDNTLLEECCIDEYTVVAEVQHKLCSTIEHGLNPDGCLVVRSDDSPQYEEKQSVVSIYDGESIHAYESTDELTSCDEDNGSSNLNGPERLLSTRKAISPSSQEKLCKAIKSIDINHKKIQKCKGELQFTMQTDNNGDAEDANDMTRTEVTNNPKKIKVISKTTKNGSNLKGVSKIRNSRSATHMGCSTLQNAITFSKQQMQDAENLTMKLTKELKSMKDIVDDMLRSEFCLNTSLRYKVNEARMAVKSATKAEEGAKRWLSFMSRDCNRFCTIMKLADSSPSTPQNVVRKEKKIAFSDEAGGKLCQVRFYEDDEGHLTEPK